MWHWLNGCCCRQMEPEMWRNTSSWKIPNKPWWLDGFSLLLWHGQNANEQRYWRSQLIPGASALTGGLLRLGWIFLWRHHCFTLARIAMMCYVNLFFFFFFAINHLQGPLVWLIKACFHHGAGSYELPLLPGNRLLHIPLIWTDAFMATEFRIDFIFLMRMQPKEGNKAKTRVSSPPPPPVDFPQSSLSSFSPFCVWVVLEVKSVFT